VVRSSWNPEEGMEVGSWKGMGLKRLCPAKSNQATNSNKTKIKENKINSKLKLNNNNNK
jgi:hypothetical protein